MHTKPNSPQPNEDETRIRHRMLDAALRYAQFDRSDPFAYRRAVSHINNGVATVINAQGKEGYYDAEETQENKQYIGEGGVVKYTIPAFRGVIKP